MVFTWEQRKLGDISNIQGGGTPSSKKKSYWNGNINWFTPTEVFNQGYLGESTRKITQEGLQRSSATLLPVGTILLTSRAGVGDMGILTYPAATNQGFQSIIPSYGLNSYFLFAMQPIISKAANRLASGSTFTEISGKQVAKIKLIIPNTEQEQSSVASITKMLDNLIAANECGRPPPSYLFKIICTIYLRKIE